LVYYWLLEDLATLLHTRLSRGGYFLETSRKRLQHRLWKEILSQQRIRH